MGAELVVERKMTGFNKFGALLIILGCQLYVHRY